MPSYRLPGRPLRNLGLSLLLTALLGSAHADGKTATFKIGGGQVPSGGYMARVVFRQTTADLQSRETEIEEHLGSVSLGPFDLSKDTPGRFNINFQNSRSLSNCPDHLKEHRISFASIRVGESRVRLFAQLERMLEGSWKAVGVGTADVPIGAPEAEVSVVPQDETFSIEGATFRYTEIGIRIEARDQD